MLILNKLSDTELINLMKANHDEALTVIYKRYWNPLFISAYNILKDNQACEDIIQDVFINLWTKRTQIEFTVSLKAYLYASIRYEVFRQIRKGFTREDISNDLSQRLHAPVIYRDLEYKELVGQVASIVNTLPEKCKEVYKLSRNEHLSHKEIADQLNISTKTVENHLTKALRHLRVSLGQILFLVFVLMLFNNKL